MKQKIFLMALAGVAFAACSNHDDYFAGKTMQEAKYEQSFITRFGQPSSNHTWGFGPVTRTTRSAWEGQTDGAISVNTEGNNWWKYIELPNPITKEEQKKVYDVFRSTHVTNVQNPNWSRFFVQQVWTGTDTYTGYNKDNAEKSFMGSNYMNGLLCGKSDASMGHINNGNSGAISVNGNVQVAKQGDAYDPNNGETRVLKDNELPEGIMLIENGGTACFGFHNSADSKNYANYLMLEIDGEYYVGFDWEINDDNDGVYIAGDKDYTDWIVKVVPGDYKKSPNRNGGETKRVFCEDLGSTDDFDFNDIVLDVVNAGAKTIITLRAAGGTLPAYIKVGSEELGEVHELFGVAQNTMVNTRTKGAVERPIVVLEVNGTYTAGDVQIIVENTEGIKYELNAAKGSIPYKFATPIGVDWTNEREQIETKYPNFKNWVADENNPFWE